MREYVPPPKSPDDFPADRVMGIILLAIDALETCVLLLLSGGAHWSDARKWGGQASAVALTGLAVLVVMGIVAFVHYGIFCGRRWAFIGGLIFSLCGLAGSVSQQASALTVVVAFSTMVYTAMRLGEAIGPYPE